MTGFPAVLLVGAGKMGSAMFRGWCASGVAASVLVDPNAACGVGRDCDVVVGSLAAVPAGFVPSVAVLAVKPQVAGDLIGELGAMLPAEAVVLSILAGKTLAWLEAGLASGHAMVRAMPNLPASIGQSMTVACACASVSPAQKSLCDGLLGAVGDVAWLPDETLIDRITAVSGCGPAYLFLLAELLEVTAIEQGIPPDLARRLARRTVCGAASLLDESGEDAAALRQAVTSARGVTEQALLVLMAEDSWPRSIREALLAAVRRAGELAA